MNTRRTLLLILVLPLVLAGCRKPPEEVEMREPVYPAPPVEDFEGLYAYAIGEEGYCAIDLFQEDLAQRSKTTTAVTSGCLSTDGRHLYLGVAGGVATVDLVRARITQRISLGATPRFLFANPKGAELFALEAGRRLSVIKPSGDVSSIETAGAPVGGLITPDGAKVVISVSAPPRSFIEIVDWVLNNVVRTIDIPNVKQIAVTPYGVRMYLLSDFECFVYDGRSFDRIGKMDFPVSPDAIRMTPAGNKIYFVAGSKVYVASRVKNSIVSEFDVAGNIVDLVFSPDGGYAYIASENPSSLLVLDAATDSIIFSKGLDDVPQELALSPGGSRVYVLTGSDSVAVFDVTEREFTSKIPLGFDAFHLMVNRNRVSLETEPAETAATVTEGFREGFTIQVSSSRDISSANALAARLRSSGYPAYVSSSDTPDGLRWYRVRVGAFDERSDAETVARGISNFQGIRSWVTFTTINISILPELPSAGRDMDSDGKPEAVYKVDPRHLVIYEIDRGVYARVYETSRDQDIYLGEPDLQDVDSDGDQEAVTRLLEEGKVSVIDLVEGVYTERLISR